jgi:two-component system phosphate regulon response regulator PhoB
VPERAAGRTPATTVVLKGADAAYCDLLAYVLETEGFHVVEDVGPAAGNRQHAVAWPDVVVLELVASDAHAHQRLQDVQQACVQRRVPLLVLLADGSQAVNTLGSLLGERSRLVAKSVGARGIILALRQVLRSEVAQPAEEILSYADLHMDTGRYLVTRAGQEIHLTPVEFRLLRHFMAHAEHVLTREQLAQAGWPQKADVGSRSVDVYVGRLRRVLTAAAPRDLIRTVRSIGYALRTR